MVFFIVSSLDKRALDVCTWHAWTRAGVTSILRDPEGSLPPENTEISALLRT